MIELVHILEQPSPPTLTRLHAKPPLPLLSVHEAVANESPHLTAPPLLERLRRNEARERLLPLLVPVRLPPVLVLLAYHMQNIALVEAEAELLARHVNVLRRLVVVQGSHMQDIVHTRLIDLDIVHRCVFELF